MDSSNSFMLFSGTSHPTLARAIGDHLSHKLNEVKIERFPDKEIGVQICENVRGQDVFLVQSIARHPNLYLMELLILVDALRRASARSIVAVIPYFGYARQDRKDKRRVPITAKLVANLLETAGVSRVLTMDLHSEQIQGFFDIPVDNLYGHHLLAERLKRAGSNPVVVAPDLGSVKLARTYADTLGCGLAVVEKQRESGKDVAMRMLIGDVEGKDALLVDDISSTGKTLKEAAFVVKEAGAKSVTAAVTHGLIIDDHLKDSPLDTLIVTDTIPPAEGGAFDRVEIVEVAPLFAKAITSLLSNQSLSALYR